MNLYMYLLNFLYLLRFIVFSNFIQVECISSIFIVFILCVFITVFIEHDICIFLMIY